MLGRNILEIRRICTPCIVVSPLGSISWHPLTTAHIKTCRRKVRPPPGVLLLLVRAQARQGALWCAVCKRDIHADACRSHPDVNPLTPHLHLQFPAPMHPVAPTLSAEDLARKYVLLVARARRSVLLPLTHHRLSLLSPGTLLLPPLQGQEYDRPD